MIEKEATMALLTKMGNGASGIQALDHYLVVDVGIPPGVLADARDVSERAVTRNVELADRAMSADDQADDQADEGEQPTLTNGEETHDG